MMTKNTSLINADDAQMRLPLPSSDDMPDELFHATETAPEREFTGARLFSRDIETYKAIVALSAEGLGAIRIGKILHVSPNTVLAVREREGGNVDIEKQRLSSLARAGARMCVEGIIEGLSDPANRAKTPLRDQGVIAGILVDKAELLSGSPTSRVAFAGGADESAAEYLVWLRREYASQTGSREGNANQKEAAAAGGPVVDAEWTEEPGAGGREDPTGAHQEPGAQVDPDGAHAAPGGARDGAPPDSIND